MNTTRYGMHPEFVKGMDTESLRKQFLIESLFSPDNINYTYTMHDRMIIMGINPVKKELSLPAYEDHTKADYFLERREMGVINVGAKGTVKVDGESFDLEKLECLYIGKGAKEVVFSSGESSSPAEFYINSVPAHKSYPITKAVLSDANMVSLGTKENCNERVIYQYIHEEGIQSCQLVMGFTELKTGSIWNTFPPHTHERRMEAYFYFDIADDQVIMHFMGDPEETRHIVMRNKQAVISPEWSIHAGAATSNYRFIWGMGGENKAFTDMDAVDMSKIK